MNKWRNASNAEPSACYKSVAALLKSVSLETYNTKILFHHHMLEKYSTPKQIRMKKYDAKFVWYSFDPGK